jgi:PRTRC genetic system protein C
MTPSTAQRAIVLEGRNGKTEDLPDLNPAGSVEDVVKMLAVTRPELATAVVEGPVQQDDKLVYTIKTQLGYKG